MAKRQWVIGAPTRDGASKDGQETPELPGDAEGLESSPAHCTSLHPRSTLQKQHLWKASKRSVLTPGLSPNTQALLIPGSSPENAGSGLINLIS